MATSFHLAGPCVRSFLNASILEITDTDLSSLDDATLLTETEVDSLDLIEVGMMAEEEWDIRIDPESFNGVQDLGALVAMIVAKIDDIAANG